MGSVMNTFAAVLAEFKKNLTTKELQEFQLTTLNDVRITALRIQKDQERVRSTMHMACLESFLEAMTQFGKVIEVFANSKVFVAFVWGPLKFILQTASTWVDSFESMLDAYKQIGEHMPLLEQHESLFGSKPHMQRILILMYADILAFHKKAVRMFRGRAEVWRHLFRSLWKDFDAQFKVILEELRLHRHLVVEQAALYTSEGLFAHIQQYEQDRWERLNRFKSYEQNERDRKYLALLNWFSAAPSTFEDQDTFRAIRTSHRGIGDWITKHEKVQNWRDTDIPVFSSLWISGIPGVGKTILTSGIIDSCLQHGSHFTSYFYCREADPKKNNAISIFRGLLSQLLHRRRDLIPYCYEKIHTSGETILTSMPLAERFLSLFVEDAQRQFIILDGLNECDLDQRKLVTQTLTSIVDKYDEEEPGKLRLLVVSQDFPDIKKAFQTADIMKLTPEDNKSDIKIYGQEWSKHIKAKYQLDDEQDAFIQESILIRSKGMFLYAKLTMENLYTQETRSNLLKEIDIYSFSNCLGEAYERILCRLERSLFPKQWQVVLHLLGWMVCAKRPLKWREIQAAVSIDAQSQTTDFESKRLQSGIEEYCGSLVQVFSGDRVELVHNTAKIYIMESRYISASIVECNLAALCLRYLTFRCFDDEVPADELVLLLREGLASFQDYAIAKWSQHIHAFIERGPNIRFNADQTAQMAFQELDLALDEFFIRYLESSKPSTIPQEVAEYCEPFKAFPFHTNLVFVWNHIYQHHRKGPEARHEVSLESLNRVLLRNRDVLESLSSDVTQNNSMIIYGDKPFKCQRPTCFYFHEGFKDDRSRKEHLKCHDRPFDCTFPDCSVAEFGFSSNKDLEKHMRAFHPEAVDQNNMFSIQAKAATQSRMWICDLCGKGFTRGFHQRNHLLSHAGEMPYKCSWCGKAFTRNNDCKRHEKIHARGR